MLPLSVPDAEKGWICEEQVHTGHRAGAVDNAAALVTPDP
jgi:hypothetical protein